MKTKKDEEFSLNIIDLQLKHQFTKNRLSDKLNRRDVAFYDLYALHEPKDEIARIRAEGGYPYTKQDMDIAGLYGDLAFDDFNDVWKRNGDIVRQQYG